MDLLVEAPNPNLNVNISRYSELSDVVDHWFPPLVQKDDPNGDTKVSSKVQSGNFYSPDQYSDCTYWKEPLPDIEIKELEEFKQLEESGRWRDKSFQQQIGNGNGRPSSLTISLFSGIMLTL